MATYQRLLLALALLLTFSCKQADAGKQYYLNGHVVGIIDGDTFDLLTEDRQKIRIRLHGIDCPERGQDFYQVCKKALSDLCFDRDVRVLVIEKDRNKRTVAEVYLPGNTTQLVPPDSQWVNLIMVRNGLAWHFTRYSDDARLAAAEKLARRQKAGLWRMPAPIAPREWRKARRPQPVRH